MSRWAPGPRSVVGRDDERAALRRALGVSPGEPAAESAGHGPVALVGDPGIGKSALWRALLAESAEAGWRVLAAAPTEAETTLTFAGLGDLLGDVGPSALDAVDPPQRHALEVALLRREPAGPPADVRAVGLATAGLLDALAATQPVLVAVDDVGWLDAPTATVLAFALRRVERSRVRVLVTCRAVDDAPEPMRPLLRHGAARRLGALSLGATQQLLRRDVPGSLTHGDVRRIHHVSSGNPLHAMELARAQETPDPDASAATPLPGAAAFSPPRELADLVRRRLARLPASTRDLLLAVAASSRATIDELRALAGGTEPLDDVQRAVDSGLVAVDGERLRFTHPLYASACYRGATQAARREMHARLASVVTDEEQRCWHLARAGDDPDEDVAAALAGAARQARRRGAVENAAELMLLAWARTPGADSAQVGERARDACSYLTDAGHANRAKELMSGLVADAATTAERVRNLVALSAIVYELEGPGASRRLSEAAIAAADGDPLLLADAHLSFAERSHANTQERLAHVTAGVQLLEQVPDPDPALHARLLRETALARYHCGEGLAVDLLQRAAELEKRAGETTSVGWRARSCMGECLKYVDGFAEAHRLLAETEALAEELGDVVSLAGTLAHQAELLVWLGRWDEADERAARAASLVTDSDQLGRMAFAICGRLLVAAHRGDYPAARAFGAQAVAAARTAGDEWAEALVHAALGFTELAAGCPQAAVDALDRADAFLWTELLTEPRQWRYLTDYVEALAHVGAHERAAERLARLEQWAATAKTCWPRVMAARARGVLLERTGDADGALAALEEAAALADSLPLPFVRARTRLALGAALRRSRSKRRARELLTDAEAAFASLGAPTWAARAQDELARISGRAASGSDLTETEQRVAALVAEGRSNKDVAAALVVTPRTVEAHLTRIYAKLGLRSRAELVRRGHSVGVSALPPTGEPS